MPAPKLETRRVKEEEPAFPPQPRAEYRNGKRRACTLRTREN